MTDMRIKEDHVWEYILKPAVEPKFIVVVY